MVRILTAREKEIIGKKVKGLSLTQNESNILSKSIRPKLEEIKKIDADTLLDRLEYNQKGRSTEEKINKLILDNMKEVRALVMYGSAIQTNYKRYNDIDLLIITKKKIWDKLGDKYDLIIKLTNIAKNEGLNLDIQIVDNDSFNYQYPHNPSLIYQLKDSKIIYGKINIPSKTEILKLDLQMKLDWSYIDDEESKGSEIYNSVRNVILVRMLLNKIVNNELLRDNVYKEIGKYIILKLKRDIASKQEKRLVLEYIRDTLEKTEQEIRGAKWEKIVL